MSLTGADAGWLSLWVQVSGALLFCLAFTFLWRQSGVVYFGLWGAAWAAEAGSLACWALYTVVRAPQWLILYAFFEFAFAILLVASARAGFSGSLRSWRPALKILFGFPIFVAAFLALGWQARFESFHVLHVLVLCAVYVYNYASIRGGGVGGKIFRFSLACLAAGFLHHAVLLVFLYVSGPAPAWVPDLHFNTYYDFTLNALLALSAMAMWIEGQNDRMREVWAELEHVRKESARNLDLDRLTGLLNQAALSRRMEDERPFEGVVSVCDMDEFKEINDRYGHLVGDEILSNIGHLLRASIRQEDEAFRWGGDEFVILFRNENRDVARRRMEAIQQRLRGFQVRGHGTLPISFSWGTAEAVGRSLRDALDEADRDMYAFKRKRR
jgi:diguanylate cyclase (GGDEF)-like protein